DTITYAFTVQNTGNTTLTNITVTDPGVTMSGGPIASLAQGAVDNTTFTASYTITQADVDNGSFSNQATASGNPPTGPPVTDLSDSFNPADGPGPDDPTITQLPAASGLELIKAATVNDGGDGQVDAGDTVTYTFTVNNTGNTTLTNITVTDPGVTMSGGPIASLAPGASDTTTFTASYTITPADLVAGSFSNQATANATDPGSNPVTDLSDSANPADGPGPDDPTVAQFPPQSSIELIKAATLNDGGDGQADAGDTITYAFTVNNTGNTVLSNITLTDPGVTMSGGPIVSLAPATSDTTTFTATRVLTQADIDSGSFSNQATANATDPASNPVTDLSDSANPADGPGPDDPTNQPLAPAASMALVKAATINDGGDGQVDAGDTISYTFSVENTGNVTLTNITVTDPLVTMSGGPIASLAPGVTDTTTFTANYTITQADVDNGSVSNQATAAGTDPGSNPITDLSDSANPADGPGPDDPTVAQFPSAAGMSLVKTGTLNDGGDGQADAGDTISYTFSVTNTGNQTLTNITVTDPGVTMSGGPIASLAVGASDNTTFTATRILTQADVDAGSFTNSATATGTDPSSNPVTDISDSGNAAGGGPDDPTVIPLPPNAGIELIKTATINDGGDGQVDAGDTVSYAFSVRNTGNVTLTNIAVTDPGVTVSGGPIASLAPGVTDTTTFTASYTITQADVNNGSFSNQATATGTDPASNPVTDLSDSGNVPGGGPDDPTVAVFPAQSAVELIKAATLNDGGDGQADAGDTISYAFTVNNTGNTTLTNITVTDPVATMSGGPIASLAPGVSDTTTFTASYTITQADVDAGSFSNQATANATDPAANPVTDLSDSANPADGPGPDDPTVQPLAKAASLALIKGATIDDGGDGQIDAGDTINYTFSVQNTGNVTLTNIAVTDPLVTMSGGPIATLAPGATDATTFTASYTITQVDVDNGSVSNQATATGADPASLPVTDLSDSANPADGPGPNDPTVASFPSAAGISLVKAGTLDDGGNGRADAGDTINYTFTVRNIGNQTLTSVTVTDPLVSMSGGPIASLAPGATDNTTFTATYTVTQTDVDAGSFANSATVTGTDPSSNPVTDVSDSANPADGPGPDDPTTTPLPAASSLELVKIASVDDGGDGRVDAGDTVVYVFSVQNTGNTTLTNITVTDPLVTVSGGPIASLAPGATNATAFTAVYTITQADIDAGSFTNSATVTGTDPSSNPVTDLSDNNNPADTGPDDPTVATFPSAGSLELVKTATLNDGGDGRADAGDTVSYAFTVNNTGNVTLTSITVTDPLVTMSGGPITSLAPGASDTTTFTAIYTLTQADIDNGTLTNSATVTGSDPASNPVTDLSDSGNAPGGGPDDPTVQVLPKVAGMALIKTGTINDGGDGQVDAGDTISYAFTVTNTGNVTLTNVTVTDPGVTMSGGPIASLGPGATDTTTFTGTYTILQADVDAGFFTNQATAAATDPQSQPVTDLSDPASPAGDAPTVTNFPSAAAISFVKAGTLNDGGDGRADVGDTISFAFTVQNTGNQTLTNVTVTDPGLTVLGGPIASLAPGATDNTTFTATHTLTQANVDAGSFTNQATV
ncbi:MAG: beta strand repeat-containing protein, partial [Hyphomicrobiaceae bacterium]